MSAKKFDKKISKDKLTEANLIKALSVFHLNEKDISELTAKLKSLKSTGIKGEKLKNEFEDFLIEKLRSLNKEFSVDWRYLPSNVLYALNEIEPKVTYKVHREYVVDTISDKEIDLDYSLSFWDWNIEYSLMGEELDIAFAYEDLAEQFLDQISEVLEEKLNLRIINYDTGADCFGFLLFSNDFKIEQLDCLNEFITLIP